MTATGSINPVLSQYYAQIYPLSEYLDALIPSKPHSWTTEADTATFRDLLQTTLVALRSSTEQIPTYAYYHPQCSQSEVKPLSRLNTVLNILRSWTERMESSFNGVMHDHTTFLRSDIDWFVPFSLYEHFAKPFYQCETKDELGKPQPGRVNISNYAVNSMVVSLTSPDWSLLLQRRRSNVPSPGLNESISSCRQRLLLSGHWFAHTRTRASPARITQKGSARDMVELSCAFKKQKLGEEVSLKKPRFNSPNDIRIMRARMFYASAKHLSHIKLRTGLPAKHILNRISSGEIRSISVRRDREWDGGDDIRLLAKYIFPRQYGLHNVFTCEKARGPWPFKDYTVRDQEIHSQGTKKTPKRLQSVLPLLGRLLNGHKKLDYDATLSRTCPSKLKMTANSTVDSSVILELMSESTQPSSTQLFAPDGHQINTSAPPIHKQTSPKPRFAEFMCSHREVISFVLAITSSVIPNELWGSAENYKHVSKRIAEFIDLRRHESLTLHSVAQNVKVLDFAWAFPEHNGNKVSKRPPSDANKARELVDEFLYWYFDSFLLPLLKTTFYCTESSAFKSRVLYFRQDDWLRLTEPLLDKLCSETFIKVPLNEVQQDIEGRKLGYGQVRLLPKETGVRPIVNLGRKLAVKERPKDPGFSINQMLQATFQILTFEKQRNPSLQGYSVTDSTGIYTKLKQFKERHRSPDGRMPKLYFVKLDVRACFDTIDQGLLLEIIQRIIQEENYLLQRYTQVYPMVGKIQKRFTGYAIPEDETLDVLTLASKLATIVRHTVFTDQVVQTFEERDEVLSLLEEHITSNIVKIRGEFYKQQVGIPQGSVLSTILCNFFYGDLEASNPFSFVNDPSHVLLRYMDDYLLVSTSLSAAHQFLEMMKQGHPQYGCFIAEDKTITNFEHIAAGTVVREENYMPWCGLHVNLQSLDVSIDFTRFQGKNILNALSVDSSHRPAASFKYKIMSNGKLTSRNITSSFAVRLKK
ncbi:Telomerase reverse transcriptase {ECO:0000312/PomBase:SPBC29A3.14c} {ECO:0000269/PubMed:24793650}; AltName: Full=Telomerase catalytic subunit {ECO:0000303/PubMed:9252327} [Serendipita indica DSM 11827]|nr:Telomerase reverse transcriptase {ECO:0000312/PomBase:SPBC29A3.14c} {ECO:0000269/PubMed:24793650}; AltName: Full=Telomerase catalytic subunit {ECO:0000303/PubMed:9252327} [Serendipita indica DSM 11827]